jgi:cyclophilin family peptidyl-prolyl cis-trans isomerase/HEAT repeat protein
MPTPPTKIAAALGSLLFALGALGTPTPAASLAPASAPQGNRTEPAETSEEADLRAMLLLVQERRVYEPVTATQALKSGPAMRAELALALGRIGDPEGEPLLEGLLIDPQPAVRRAAAFGLGLRADLKGLRGPGAAAAQAALLKAVRDGDRETGALAVEALARLKTPVLQVAEQLLALPEAERWPRLLPYLYRFKEEALLPIAEHGLALGDAELHRWSAYALARDPLPAAAPLLRPLLADPDPLVRAWAARALSKVGAPGDLAALAPLLAAAGAPPGSADPGPVIEALKAAATLRRVAPTAVDEGGFRPRLLALFQDVRPGVRATALDAASGWLPDAALSAALVARAAGPAPGGGAVGTAGFSATPGAAAGGAVASRAAGAAGAVPEAIERGMALVSLARGGDPRAAALTLAAAGDAVPQLRARAAEAAGLLGDQALLARLAKDASPLVREAALTARLPTAPRPAPGSAAGKAAATGGGTGGRGAGGFSAVAERAGGEVAVAALSDADEGVRTTACDWLGDHPVAPFARLAGALTSALRDESIESPLAVLRALAARAQAEPRERGAAVELIERVAAQPSYVLRREASAALEGLGRQAPPLGGVDGVAGGSIRSQGAPGAPADSFEVYKLIVESTRRPHTVEVHTNRGTLRLRLDCPQAPRTCLNFLQLARQHFYDGLLFHRVVPDFVVQTGDPRGDGFGGPGYTLRDELNPARYRRGVVGMALAGPDTGGSQFFITLSPQPHLDGGYTVFGEVVAGFEVLDALRAGDRIEHVVEIP